MESHIIYPAMFIKESKVPGPATISVIENLKSSPLPSCSDLARDRSFGCYVVEAQEPHPDR